MSDFENDRLVMSDGARAPRRRPMVRPGLPSRGETFSDRVWRLCLNSQLGAIGVGQWKHLMDQHRGMTDQQLLDAVSSLERRPASTERA